MKRNLILSTLASALLAPAIACAHPQGATSGFLSGLAHPFLGLDHVLAMLMVGVVAARMGDLATLIVPITFVAGMFAGSLLAAIGVTVPAVEPIVAASVLLLGLMVMLDARVHVSCGVALVAGIAIFHGLAHAAEARGSEALVAYFAGFVFATAFLHLGGVSTAWLLRRRLEVLRIAAAPIALTGAWMLASRIG